MKNTITLSFLIFAVLLGATAALLRAIPINIVCSYKVVPGTYISGWTLGYTEIKFKSFKEA